ncbi:MAG: hypothetical protein EAZ06_06245 [Cytophagales bacterium]|nr:MAG: hypothetical protein EAZ06_06245 [Cytophagales bacterium]
MSIIEYPNYNIFYRKKVTFLSQLVQNSYHKIVIKKELKTNLSNLNKFFSKSMHQLKKKHIEAKKSIITENY